MELYHNPTGELTMKRTITVSPDVAKALELGNLNADQILRDALNIKPEGFTTSEGVMFPEGTAFLAWYKDRPHWGHVKNGALDIQGDRFTSVSSAAGKITGRPTNGWDFWQCKVPGKSEFVRISKMRQQAAH